MAPNNSKQGTGRKGSKGDAAAQQHDPTRALAYILRGSKGPETRSARLEDNRVDYFRGKDLFRLLRAQPDLIDEHAPLLAGVPTPAAPTPKDREAQITAIGQYLLQKGYFVRCDRVHKTPRPGRTKRVKFPKFLETVPRNQQQFTSDGEGFYSWTYDQPMSWTFVILSVAVAFLVILMCLFPLAPIWFKKVILYTCLAILGLFFVIFVVRVVVFAVVWIVAGRQFWVLPNITSDEIPIDEVFSPMWAFDDLNAEGEVVGKIPLLSRLGAAGVAGALLVALYYVVGPGDASIRPLLIFIFFSSSFFPPSSLSCFHSSPTFLPTLVVFASLLNANAATLPGVRVGSLPTGAREGQRDQDHQQGSRQHPRSLRLVRHPQISRGRCGGQRHQRHQRHRQRHRRPRGNRGWGCGGGCRGRGRRWGRPGWGR